MSRPAALLVDFGGVLTSNVFDGFRAFCDSAGLPADAVAQAFRDPAAAPLLVAVEKGEMPEVEFNATFALALEQRTGVAVDPEDLITRMTGNLHPETAMLEVVARVREAGHPVGLVSNSFGWKAYEGYELEGRFDSVILSGEVGVRKPSRRIYALAAERIGIDPEQCVFVDDLEQNIEAARRAGMTGLHHRQARDSVPALETLFELTKDERSR